VVVVVLVFIVVGVVAASDMYSYFKPFVFVCAVSVIGLLSVDLAYKNN
jgi:hypothetical protein